MNKQLFLEKYLVVGVDLRSDEPFEREIVVEAKTSVELYFQQRGYRLSNVGLVDQKAFKRVKMLCDSSQSKEAQP